MDSETAAVFSSLGTTMEAARSIIKPGSDRFAPAMSSALNMQPNQMFVSHSNPLGSHRNSSIPIHHDQFGREMYNPCSGQYRNVPIANNSTYAYSNLRGGVLCGEKSYPQFESIHFSSSASGSIAESVSHSQSNSASDETEDQQLIDERKQRRMISNRESARRSRLRKQQHLDELRAQVAQLRAKNGQLLNGFNAASQQYVQITEENSILRSEALDLKRQLQKLHHTVNSQSHGSLRTLGPDTGHCTAAHLRLGAATVVQPLPHSNLLI